MHCAKLIPLTLLYLASGFLSVADTNDDYTAQVEKWRSGRVARLTASDGWLTLIGLHWLRPGANTVGGALDNDIVLPTAPPHLGTVTWENGGKVRIELQPDSKALIDGKPQPVSVLADDSQGKPSVISFDTTSV